jgi:membrane associated rhomboid family serine protease
MTLTLIIVIITAIISYQAFSNQSMKSKLLMRPVSVHGDMTHLLVNMYVLYIFGETIELRFVGEFDNGFGRILFLGLYLGAIIISSIPSYIKHQDNNYYGALGASGGTSAIIFAYIFFYPWNMLYLFFVIPIPAIVLGVLYLFYSSYMAKKGTDNIGHDAHFGGAVFGFVFMVVISLALKPDLLTTFFTKLKEVPFL